MNIEESIHVSFDESNVISPRKDVLDDVSDFLEEIHTHERGSKRKRDESNEDSQDYETQM